MTTEFFHRHRAGVTASILLVLSALLISLRLEPYVMGFKTTLWFFLAPKIVYTGEFFQKVDSFGGRLFRLARAEGENTILREQLTLMSKRIIERDALEEENNRLRGLLDLRQKEFHSAIPAEVIGRELRDWFHTLVINKGERDGVVPSAGVVAGAGGRVVLVGRIENTQNRTSKVLLITDLVSSLSVGIVGRPDIGLLEGRNRPFCVINYLPRDSKIVPGDEVTTMGLGGVFPPGIPVGRVTEVYASGEGFFKSAIVSPHANFGSFQEVLVLQRKPESPAGGSPK